MFLYLVQGMILGLSAAVMPGPFQAFLLSHALRNGWRRALPAAFAPLITDGPIIALILLLLTQAPEILLNVLRIAGGCFILYLARGLFLSMKKGEPAMEPDEGAARKGFFYAIAINALNPNPYIFWSAVAGPIVLTGWRESAGRGIGFLIAFYGTFISFVAVLIILFAMAGKIDARVNRILNSIAFIALCAFGIYQIILGAGNMI